MSPTDVNQDAVQAAWQADDLVSQYEYRQLHTFRALLCVATSNNFYQDNLGYAWFAAYAAATGVHVMKEFNRIVMPVVELRNARVSRNEELDAVDRLVRHPIGRTPRRNVNDPLSDEPSDEEWRDSNLAPVGPESHAIDIAYARSIHDNANSEESLGQLSARHATC